MLQIHSVITQVSKIGYYECVCHPDTTDTSDGITQIFKINFHLTNIDQWLMISDNNYMIKKIVCLTRNSLNINIIIIGPFDLNIIIIGPFQLNIIMIGPFKLNIDCRAVMSLNLTLEYSQCCAAIQEQT